MGTKVHSETILPGRYHHSMRDLNNDCILPLFNSDTNNNKTSAINDQSYKDVVRRTMLEHEAVFKSQVLELHRVYGIQKDMMDELKRKQFNKELFPLEASCSSQATNDDLRRWNQSMSVVEDNGHSGHQVPWANGASHLKHVEALELRPTKIRRKMIDLCLPPDEYVDDNEDVVDLKDHRSNNGLADLNEPFKAQETNEVAYVPVISLQHQPLRIDPYKSATTPFVQPGKPQRVTGPPPPPPPQSKAELWRGKTFIDLEADTTTTNTSHEVIHESSSFASHQQPRHLYPYKPPPDSPVQWNRCWQNPSFGFPQRVAYPVLYLSDTQSGNAQKLGGLGDRLQFESNMFYNECTSSSASKSKFSGTGHNGGRSEYSPGNAFLDLNGSEVKLVRDLNLNVTLPSNTSVVEVRKDEERLATLPPWLVKPKPACNLSSSSSLKPSNIVKEEGGGNSVKNLMWLERLKSGSCSSKPETDEKIKANESNAERDKVRIMLDINEPLSEEDQEQTETKVCVSSKCQFDLNMSVSEDADEDESWSAPPPTSSKLNSKRPMIDLETVPESDVEEEDEETPQTIEKTAAETILAISSACLDRELVASETVILHWFAETVDTHRDNLDQKLASVSRNQARSIKELDYFEVMTLQLPEITEEEYTPKPLVPEDLVLEETSVVTSHQRPRRGNARKGKQRRDFQRDILPGLLSLSRHEVTEDIQLLDGFMRAATGRAWTPSGLTRKKTGARGRPRRVVVTNPEPVVYYPVQAPSPCSSVQQQHVTGSENGEVEMGFEDGSFGGWGKMTRRPRRQRCPSSVTTTNVHHHTRMSRDGWE